RAAQARHRVARAEGGGGQSPWRGSAATTSQSTADTDDPGWAGVFGDGVWSMTTGVVCPTSHGAPVPATVIEKSRFSRAWRAPFSVSPRTSGTGTGARSEERRVGKERRAGGGRAP